MFTKEACPKKKSVLALQTGKLLKFCKIVMLKSRKRKTEWLKKQKELAKRKAIIIPFDLFMGFY